VYVNTFYLSRPGGRSENQDYCESMTAGDYTCFVLADGLGGHHGGEIASKTAAEAILSRFAANPCISPKDIRDYLLAGQNAVLETQERDTLVSAMRTTAVVLVIGEDAAVWGHVGDSRMYVFRRGSVFLQTEDHSVPQAMVHAGDLHARKIRGHEDRNRLLRTLGKDDDFRPEIPGDTFALMNGDVFLLCSDGFWEYVTETAMEIELAKAASPEEWLRGMELRITAAAEPRHDNYSAIAIFVEQE